MAITEDILVRLRVQGQQQFAAAMGGAATQTGRLGTTVGTAGKQVDATGKKAKGASGKMAAFGKSAGGAVAAVGGFYAAQAVVRAAVTNAVNLGEQINKTAVVFRGPGASAVQDWSKTTATGIGISRRAALEAAGTFGNMLVPMGLGRAEAAKMSTGMVDLAGDMASFNNASPEETLDALRAGIAGETEPLRRFGVRLSQARLEQQAMSMGLKKGKAPLTDHARALATQALILKDTKDAQGDFSRTSDSLANKQRVIAAQFENFTAALGQKLIPILSFLTGHIDALAIGVGVGLVVAFVAWTAATIAQVAATTSLAAALAATGIPLIVIAVAALVAGLIIAYRECETFRNIVDALFAAWKKIMGVLLGGVKAAIKWLIGALPKAWAIIRNAPLIWLIRNFGKIRAAVVAAFNAVKRAAATAWAAVKKGASAAWTWVKTAAGNAAKFVTNAWQKVIGFFRGIGGKIRSAASGMWDGIKDAFRAAINWVIGAWNSLSFKLPEISAFGKSIGGGTFQVPQIPLKAEGGPVTGGNPYIVGERGPELFVPGASGTVLPNGAGGAIHTHVYLNGREIATAVGNAAADRRARR